MLFRSVSEMVFSETASLDPPDWRKYEPNSCDPDEYIRGALVDDLSNLTGPWSPYVPDPADDPDLLQHLFYEAFDVRCLERFFL